MSNLLHKIELLAPAKDAATGIAAINCGADAVYIGASSFGARNAAANSVEDIKNLVEHAHKFNVKIYAALNTLLFDDEIEDAQKLAFSLYKAGIDGLIIQDTGLLEMDLPPVPLIASTQMHNNTPERVKFLEDVGFSRVILARELTIDQIRKIREATTIELECFIHGALCVGQSGQCYMSYAAGGRSGNRGQCAQPCRKIYELTDEAGEVIAKDRYLLSLKDLNLSEHIEKLIDAGITSFKIEGRLKNIPYVANIVGHYRTLLDGILPGKNLKATSSGKTTLDFTPDPIKTFNRGYTDYGVEANNGKYNSANTPKSIGEPIGIIANVGINFFQLEDTSISLNNGDGICFFNEDRELVGTVINKTEDSKIYPQRTDNLHSGLEIFRNHNHKFTKQLENTASCRKIAIKLILSETPEGVMLTGTDEDGNTASVEMENAKESAKNAELARNNISKQLNKLGKTIFECESVDINLNGNYFFTAATLNALRRNLATALFDTKLENRKMPQRPVPPNADAKYPEKELSYLGNVLNEKAKQFYLNHGVEKIEPAAEYGVDMADKLVMTTKFCVRRELGLCAGKSDAAEPLYLTDYHRNHYKLLFNCKNCGMELYSVK